MIMKNKSIAFGITGSFCTIKEVLKCMEKIVQNGYDIFPVLSNAVANMDTRFITSAEIKKRVSEICGKLPIDTICGAEPIGPKNYIDIMLIAPCSGNTLAKLNLGVTDSPVLMAAKAALRNNKPVLLAVSTNDGLSNNAKNIGELLNKKNIYFVPFSQDDYINKKFSLISDFSLILPAIESALSGKQLQPLLLKG
ncbi:MAG: dipicolinate synthase subunit B [Clostridia bacterium]|nr:dipicolinate synthase subunit B [Clostridia bacterium]